MVPLVDFVDRLRDRYPNGYVPHFDENDGGINAEILFLFEKPGPMTDPKLGGSGFISQDNDDPTARATKRFLQDAEIDRKKIAIWNTISAWNGTIKISAEEKRYSLDEFQEVLTLLPKLKCVILVGRKAQEIEKNVDLSNYQILRSYHPSQRVKNRYPSEWKGIPDIWRQAKLMNENLFENITQLSDPEICERIIAGDFTQEAYLIACHILQERNVEIPVTDSYEPSTNIQEKKLFDSIKIFFKKHPYWSVWITATIIGLILKFFNYFNKW
jgi:hypothetical protein